MIKFESVSKHYHQHRALSDVSFSIEAGEMVFLTGHSGAGKSTVLKLAMAIEHPTQGHIHIHHHNITRLSRSRISAFRRNVGMIYQNPQLLMNKTVFDNVALPLIVRGYRYREIRRRVHAALDKVSLLSKEKLTPTELSCGEQQRVGIARAVVSKPEILLADEPTGNLDPLLSLEIMHLFEAFNAAGVTVLIATHDLSLIAQMPYRMITLHNGNIITKQKHVEEEVA
ncbi:MAG: cell division ATP-binding protein FtsE [Gammaproteobacteria bacterium RIFCSPHIGHO2_12_FULL_38_14]|nr:MAG: cell division ATP-binding protein FtsE [Gammaproteobacteria bacterium RIFCSPHIGHO2_12_FULL_38_14]HLD84565.1 cell division ATP-binding protein FtsE [Coxiellaceae bacterium]